MIIISILVFIIILGLLVLVHEFGHFIVAKKSGMHVEEFGIGFPPRLFGVRRGETLYSINAVPLGGFVKILGENNEFADNPRSFINKPFFPRLLTLIAGVLMNFVFAWLLFSVGLGFGLPTVVGEGQALPNHAHISNPGISILGVDPGSPAEKAGIHEGDTILDIDGKNFQTIEQLSAYVKSKQGSNIHIDLNRGSQNLSVSVLAREKLPVDQGPIGVSLGLVGFLSYPWYLALFEGFKVTLGVIASIWTTFTQLLVHGKGLASLGGPIRIAALTNQVTKLGISYIIQFAAFLSVNLGILNILPFPALDGGRVLFLLIEKIRGKRNNQKMENLANTIGFALLIALVLIISFRDVRFLIHR